MKGIIFTYYTYNHVITKSIITNFLKKINSIAFFNKFIYNLYGDIMNFDIRRLNSNIDSSVLVDTEYRFSEEELKGTDLISCDVKVKGEIYKDISEGLAVNLSLEGMMVLPCAITLKPVKYPFNIEINEEIDELDEKNDKNYGNTIDIFPIIWENILMEIPMRVVSEEAKDLKLEGDGWKLITEEEHSSSPFDELKELIDE